MQAQPRTTTIESISAYLGWDHEQIDLIFEDARRMVDDGEAERAEDTFREGAERLGRHIRIEEEILFPLFAERTGLFGPVHVMRGEHREIERVLGGLLAALAGGDLGRAAALHDTLREVIGVHNQKEERVLYPRTDEALSPGEREAVVARMRTA
jgi:iron-sulfur cluster repair protein YtfE (RIC family)